MTFRELHRPGRPLLLPNVWEFGIGAFLAAQGFPALGTTSLGVSAVAGEPDGHPRTLDATIGLARSLSTLDTFVTVDIADGFSADPGAVADLAAALTEAGAVGVNIEDGRGEGELADVATQCALIAAMKARVPDLFVNARTDTHWFGIGPVSEAVSRVKAYADVGADGVFVPALTDSEGIEAVVRAVDLPVNVLFSPTGPSVARLAEFGVARISLGSLPYRVALAAAAEAVAAVRDGRPLPLTPPTYAEVTTLLPSS